MYFLFYNASQTFKGRQMIIGGNWATPLCQVPAKKKGEKRGLYNVMSDEMDHISVLSWIVSPKRYVEILTPGPYECDLVWK